MGNYMSSSSTPISQRGQGPRRRQNDHQHSNNILSTTEQTPPPPMHANDFFVSHVPPLTGTLSTELPHAQRSSPSNPSTFIPPEPDIVSDYMPLWSLNPRVTLQRRQRPLTDVMPSERPTRRRRLSPATTTSSSLPHTDPPPPPPLPSESSSSQTRPPHMSLLIFRRHPANEASPPRETLTTGQSTAGLFQTLMQSWSRLANPAERERAISATEQSPPPANPTSLPSHASVESLTSNPVLQMQYTFVIVGNPSTHASPDVAETMTPRTADHGPAPESHPQHHHEQLQANTVEEGLHSLIQWIAFMLNADPTSIRLENRDSPISFEDLLALEDWMGRVSRGVPQSLIDEQLKSFLYVASESDTLKNCPVCLESFQVNEKIRSLPCSHDYHTQCIDPWLTGHCNNCPLCRAVPITVNTSL